ncbi:sensor histidine kinase [Streptomyces millisiae]|uniref:histidine kinase n=1 Tax=Streptomyces millisiae TaxID=3075542 RepID=A0ABU2LXP7_9ACTN|nr:histidine kinase [Streptomyces sp. DSM 44918]MDT0322374.1 histidine kinase [Streptomyces sp. DSM 44918]
MLSSLRQNVMDLLFAVVMTVLALVTVAQTVDNGEQTWAMVVGALTVAPLALRRRAPVLTAVVILLGLLLYSLLGYGKHPNGGVGIVIAMFTVAMMRPRPVALALWLASAAVSAVTFFTAATDEVPWSRAVQAPLVVLAGGWLLGECAKHWAERAERLAGEAAREVEQGIARELHDVVGHHMAVVSAYAGVAEQVLDRDPATARTAIAAAGNSSREALVEMRRMLQLLRSAEAGAEAAARAAGDGAPGPGLASLHDLADRVRGAGVPVEVAVTGRPRALPPGLDLCAYRVAQEALTNVVKHAGLAAARIHLDYGEEMLSLMISDTGTGPGAAEFPAVSHGLRGMRERAARHGGLLLAGPGADGGFEVTLSLPIGEAA